MNLQTFVNQGIEYPLVSIQADKELVQDIQRSLNRIGLDAGTPDGVWGQRTQQAFDRFRTTHRLPINADFTPQVAQALLRATPISQPVGTAPRPTPPPPPRPTPTPAPVPRPAATPQTTNPVLQGKQRINQEGLWLIKNYEGLRLEAYICPAGVPTIGYGSTAGVQMGQKITTDEAEALLLKDLERFEAAINNAVQVPLTSNQFSALVSFTFNVGTGALRQSTLLKVLNGGDYPGAADQLLRWDKAGGRRLEGLTRRRQAERTLFLKP